MELDVSKLSNVVGGNSQKMGEKIAEENANLFRKERIDELNNMKKVLEGSKIINERYPDKKFEMVDDEKAKELEKAFKNGEMRKTGTIYDLRKDDELNEEELSGITAGITKK